MPRPFTQTGIFYDQLFTLAGGQLAYRETFARDSNLFTAHLAVDWDKAQDFRRDILGYSEFDPSKPNVLARTNPQKCPYSQSAYAYAMDLISYGRVPTDTNVRTAFDAIVTGVNAAQVPPLVPGNVSMAFYSDYQRSNWFTAQKAIYKVDYSRLLYTVLRDDQLEGSTAGSELIRYVTRIRNNNVRELRYPEYNFKPQGGTGTLKVNGFIPTTEAELIYTWYQVPFKHIPKDAIRDLRLKVNSAEWDRTRVYPADGSPSYLPAQGWPAETVLFIDAKGIDIPYVGADGGYYADIQYIFRLKWNKVSSNNYGHNHILNASGNWVKAERISNPGVFIYETTPDFNNLFTPQTTP